MNGLFEFIIAGIISGIIAGLIAVAVWWYISFRRLRKNLLGMIKDEIETNKIICGDIKKMFIDNPNSIPFRRLLSSNRDSSWTKIIEYRSIDKDLIHKISELYGFYDMFNRMIDDLRIYRVAEKKIDNERMSGEIERQYGVIKERSDTVISVIDLALDC